MQPWILSLITVAVGFLFGYFLSITFAKKVEGFAQNIDAYKKSADYIKQLKLIVNRYDPVSSKRRNFLDMLSQVKDMPESEQCFVNFQVLGCRFTGYLGPFEQGYFDPIQSVLYALKAGCRSFILEIDYLDSCVSDNNTASSYYPKLVIRDAQGKLVTRSESTLPACPSDVASNILQVCKTLREVAFSSQVQNPNDPLIIVLYLLRLPPPEKTGNARLLTYYSRIAKGLKPLLDKTIDNTINGGTFARQAQESLLLTNSIKSYEGRVLFFCNSDTSPFRGAGYSQSEDLDYIVNLRLSYKQTQLGCTSNQTGGSFGGLETTGSFLIVPPSQVDNTCDQNKLRWTATLSQDPKDPVDEPTFKALADKFGVHCVPIQLWDDKNTFMFTDDRFGKWSYIPKPKQLRFRKPPVAVPAQQTPAADAKGGMLRPPTIGT